MLLEACCCIRVLDKVVRSFPIKLHLHYEMTAGKENLHRGEGWTVSLASREIVFEADETLPVGSLVRLSIDWPARQLTLDVRGKTVEAHGQHTTVEVSRHTLGPSTPSTNSAFSPK